MKVNLGVILVLNLLITLALAGVAIRLFVEGQEKDRIILGLRSEKQSEALQAQQKEEAQKQLEAEMKIEAQKQVETERIQKINNALDRIDARLQKVLDEPSGYANETKAQRDTQEDLLKQFAKSVKTEIGVIVMEMQNAGFTSTPALEANLNVFFSNYETKIGDEHLSYDYIDLGLKDSDHKKELDAEAMRSLQAAFEARRAIRNLKPGQKTR